MGIYLVTVPQNKKSKNPNMVKIQNNFGLRKLALSH